MNALEDADITRALYRAVAGRRAGRPDRARHLPPAARACPGCRRTIRVVSIVGRFLEHGRIYYFRNGGDEEYFIGSADCMKRNLESRVEVVVPVEDPALRAGAARACSTPSSATERGAWEMQPDGTYVRGRRRGPQQPAGAGRAGGEAAQGIEPAPQASPAHLRTPQHHQVASRRRVVAVRRARPYREEDPLWGRCGFDGGEEAGVASRGSWRPRQKPQDCLTAEDNYALAA